MKQVPNNFIGMRKTYCLHESGKNIQNLSNKVSSILTNISSFLCKLKPKGKISFGSISYGNSKTTRSKNNLNNITQEQIIKTITPQAPNREFDKPIYSDKTNYLEAYRESMILEQERLELLNSKVEIINKEPKYFEEGQNGYIPSTKGVQIEEETGYIPSTKPAAPAIEDLTAAKIAIKNSYLAENITNTRMKNKFKRRNF
jgi:hypothetical protein